MIVQKVRQALKYGSVGALVGGSVYMLRKNDWEMSTVGAVRFGRAAAAAVSIVADYKWNLRNIDPESKEYEIVKSQIHTRSALKLRAMCCKNGGAFIKVGQHLGTLEYLLPQEYVTTMKVLHSDAPQSSVEDLFRVFEEDIGKKVDDVFVTFSREPLGTASLAQVHKATTKDGQVLAVKIQHPKVKAHSYVDIRTMEFLINRVAWIFPDFQYVWLAEETKKNLPKELDFIKEGEHCERAAKMYSHFKFLKVPKVYWEFSSERVLTMEYCEGGKVDDREYMKKHNIDVNEISRDLGKLYSEMIFVNGYVHCDPHPGNVLVNKTKQGTQIVLLDHGLYQTLTDDFRINYCKLWMSLIQTNLKGIEKYSKKLNVGRLFPLFACMLTARSWEAVTHGIDTKEVTDQENQELRDNAATYFIEISQVLNSIPRQMLLIMKTNDVLRGIEAALQTRANASSFINMSKCCIRALGREKLHNCDGLFQTFRTRVYTQFQLARIEIYEFILWLRTSVLVRWLSRNKQLTSS
ncbi:aarF domain-containing protein kinase 1-like [Mercenaria mercenaria]|uniref:aarF domain-containing protein kinase 1-like n=1 Tax=Mercenaria mercenaria TaxID=6596 RepID=UPI001E1DAAA9|nr:aarF domain-containing protein kinase 1-like [Mercenaria mercenaria]XP_045185753.1 aarF domain-containing protein kinase 1-like [Mercenaria mercenaria]